MIRSSLFAATALLGLSAFAQPSLVSVQPARGATGVPVSSSVVFVFDTPMEPITPLGSMPPPMPGMDPILGAIRWSSNLSDQFMGFTHEWSEENMVLTWTYNGALPGNSLITWELNPPGAMTEFTDEDGLPLPTTSGSFTTGEGQAPCDPEGVPEGFGQIMVSKSLRYRQTGPGTPELIPSEPAAAYSLVQSPVAETITTATLQTPGGTLSYEGLFGMFFLDDTFATQTALDAAWPAGNYTVNLQTSTRNVAASMMMPTGYPPVPQVGNFAAAQSVEATAPFTLTWNAFTGASGQDFISLSIFDPEDQVVFYAPDPCVPIELPVSATSITIPADTLENHKVYEANLVFAKSFHFSTNNPSQFLTSGSIFCMTEFTIQTGGTVVVPRPRVSNPEFPAGGPFRFTVADLQPGTVYRVEVSSSEAPPSWTLLTTLTPTGSTASVEDTGAGATRGRLYRVTAP